MTRYIDADALDALIVESYHMTEQEYVRAGYSIVRLLIDKVPTADAVPAEYLQRIAELYEDGQFVCDWMTDNGGDYCDEHCNYSCAQGECIRRYLELTAERRGEE